MSHVVIALLWFSALGCGVMAGVYFAFSGFVMTALDRLGPGAALAAMNAINRTILRSAFMPLFLATSASALALAVMAPFHWGEAETWPMLAGALIYMLGMPVCTIVCNVPLNDVLAEVDPAGSAAGPAWAAYLRDWTRWNHVRTAACAIATACFIAAITVI
jgi:uncharacterized membrane protein